MAFYYFVDKEGVRQGPLPLEDLQSHDITPNTLVWCRGMKNWCRAKNVEELNSLFTPSEPEPTPSEPEKEDNAPIIEEPVSPAPNPVQTEEPQPQQASEPTWQAPAEFKPMGYELSKWNWGAFFFNFIWGIFNGVYWPLVGIVVYFIPFIGPLATFGISIYLGVNGTQLAWTKREWSSWESFKSTQRNWAIAALFCLLGPILISIIVLLS